MSVARYLLPFSLTIGVAMASAPLCNPDQLRFTQGIVDAGMSQMMTQILVQNRGTETCSLPTYPTVTGIGANPSTVIATHQTQNYFVSEKSSDATVELLPQQRVWFGVYASQAQDDCPSFSLLSISIDHTHRHLIHYNGYHCQLGMTGFYPMSVEP